MTMRKNVQLAALEKADCEKIFTDKGISGATNKRSALIRYREVGVKFDLSKERLQEQNYRPKLALRKSK